MKRLSVCLVSVFLLALIGLTGCSNPESHVVEPQPEFRDGIPLTQDDLVGANPVIPIPENGEPYVVKSDLLIPQGMTLTIEPGVTLMFTDEDSLLWMKIEGKLIAKGNPNMPITFTTARYEADYGQWRGLAFLSETEQSEIEYCIFEYGAFFELDTVTQKGKEAQLYAGMLAVLNSSPIIRNNIIFYNQNNGIYVTGPNAAPDVRYNIIFKNDACAIRADTSTYANFVPWYNCGAENSSLDFLMPDPLIGRKITVNANLDSTDPYYNMTLSPLFMDWQNGDFRPQSCSPCIDAGPPNIPGPAADEGRIDFGVFPYVKSAAELRGVQSGALSAETPYRMSCHVRIPPGETLTIPAGTIINISGYYNFEVFGTLIVEGTSAGRVYIRSENETASKGDWGVLLFRYDSLQTVPSCVSYTDFEGFDYAEVSQPGATFTHCAFRHGLRHGMRVSTGLDDGVDPVVIDHCEFDDLGVYGLRAEQSSIIVRNTVIENCIGDGLVLVGEPSVEDETSQLHNNVVRDCGVNGILCETFISARIINNVVEGVGYVGIQCYNNSSPLILNNIIIACGRPGIAARTSSFPTVNYNDVWENNVNGESVVNYQGITPGVNDISLDPLFVVESLYELGDGSPCINSGHPADEYNDSDGSPNDMGAYGGPDGGGVGPSAPWPSALARAR